VLVAVGGLAGMDAIWRNRFRGVRRALLGSSRQAVGRGQSRIG
jgi:hypothetical protein